MERSYRNPVFRLILQDTELEDGMYVYYRSSKQAHCDLCRISFEEEALDIVSGRDVSDCRVDMGEQEDFENIIEGSGRWNSATDELVIRDELSKLSNTTIKATFVESTPQEAIRYILCLCGIDDYVMTKELFDSKKTFTVDSLNGCDAIKEVNSTWGIDKAFFIWDGTFYWGDRPEQEEVFELNDSNILDISEHDGAWEVDAIGIPWIHHSQYININCEELIAVGETESVTIQSSNDGSVDMTIRFREVEEID